MLEIKKLSCGYGGLNVLEDITFTIKPGEVVCILGPNGSGKSTLIKTIVGLLKPHSGNIFLNNRTIENWSWRERAKVISYIPQVFNSTFQYKSIDIVLMGRTSHLNLISSPNKQDRRIAEKAMETLNILDLKDKIYSQLSGGERQMVKIAQALAQESKIIIMDEPTNNLDFGNQIAILKYIKKCSDKGITIIMATHFPEHALIYGDKAILVNNKKIIEIDKPIDNLKESHLEELYNVDLKLAKLDLGNKKIKTCLPLF